MIRGLWQWLRLRMSRTPQHVPLARMQEPLHVHADSPTGDRIETRRLVTVNGVPIIEAGGGTMAILGCDGSVRELEHTALLLLGDGTLTDRLTAAALARCDTCAQLAAGAGLTASQCLLVSLHRTESLQRATGSGDLLCPKHRKVVQTPQGLAVLSLAEVQAIAAQERLGKPFALLRRVFLETSNG